MKKVKLFILVRVLHIKTKLLKVGGDDVFTTRMVMFIIKRLIDDLIHSFGLGRLEFYNGYDLTLFEYSTICFF
jgi:hypothetical protein